MTETEREREDVTLDIRPEDEPPGIHVSGESVFRSHKGIAHGTLSSQMGHFFEARTKREREQGCFLIPDSIAISKTRVFLLLGFEWSSSCHDPIIANIKYDLNELHALKKNSK